MSEIIHRTKTRPNGVDRDVVELTLVTYYLEFSSPQRVIRSVKKTLRLASLYGVDRDVVAGQMNYA